MPQLIIFISNSPKDGFREGDGDLLDKLTSELNTFHPDIAAIRIIGEPPPAEIHRPPEQLVVIDQLPEPEELNDLHPAQQKIINYVVSYPATHKIFYIGSRIDNFRKRKDGSFSISVGSGALLTEDLVLALKSNGVKIVICCLEVIFHTRSLFSSFRLYETLRNHLQHADAIHYLTARDKQYIERDLEISLSSKKRLVSPEYPTEIIENALFTTRRDRAKKMQVTMGNMRQFFVKFFDADASKYKEYFSYFHGGELLKKIKEIPGFYASGVCTITGLPAHEVVAENLLKRPNNILVFGLIRSHKGIEEGLALGRLLKEKNSQSVVYVAGKILSLSSIIKKIFTEVFDEESLQAVGISLNQRMCACYESSDYNTSFQELYHELVALGVKKKANVELMLDVSEDDLLKISWLCRYALKMDLKGFAENASSMISTMLGLCLPIIAQGGLVSPDFIGSFIPALHLLSSGVQLCRSEVVPEPVNIESLFSVIDEPQEQYLSRVEAILRLRSTGQFSIQNTAMELMHNLNSQFLDETPSVEVSGNPYSLFHHTNPTRLQTVSVGCTPLMPIDVKSISSQTSQ